MVSVIVPYADWGDRGELWMFRVLSNYFLLKSIIFKVCEHECMSKCAPPPPPPAPSYRSIYGTGNNLVLILVSIDLMSQ